MDKLKVFTESETDDYMKLLRKLVESLLERKMMSPMTAVAVGPNGHVSCAQLSLDDNSNVVQLKKLCSYPDVPDLYIPAHIMIVDATAETICVNITREDIEFI